MDPWQLRDESLVFDGHHPVVRRRYRRPDGHEGDFDITLRGPGVVVLPLTAEDDVVLVRQFRPGPGRVMLDLPGGFVDEGEEPAAAARRELHEETGLEAGELVAVGRSTPDPYSDEVRHVFLATGCTRAGGQDTDDGEDVELVRVSVAEFRCLLREDELATIDAAYLALDAAGRL